MLSKLLLQLWPSSRCTYMPLTISIMNRKNKFKSKEKSDDDLLNMYADLNKFRAKRIPIVPQVKKRNPKTSVSLAVGKDFDVLYDEMVKRKRAEEEVQCLLELKDEELFADIDSISNFEEEGPIAENLEKDLITAVLEMENEDSQDTIIYDADAVEEDVEMILSKMDVPDFDNLDDAVAFLEREIPDIFGVLDENPIEDLEIPSDVVADVISLQQEIDKNSVPVQNVPETDELLKKAEEFRKSMREYQERLNEINRLMMQNTSFDASGVEPFVGIIDTCLTVIENDLKRKETTYTELQEENISEEIDTIINNIETESQPAEISEILEDVTIDKPGEGSSKIADFISAFGAELAMEEEDHNFEPNNEVIREHVVGAFSALPEQFEQRVEYVPQFDHDYGPITLDSVEDVDDPPMSSLQAEPTPRWKLKAKSKLPLQKDEFLTYLDSIINDEEDKLTEGQAQFARVKQKCLKRKARENKNTVRALLKNRANDLVPFLFGSDKILKSS